jgi:transcriptional regulator with XRE-family HTH domain
MDYGTFMRERREARGMTQPQLAAALDGVPGCKQTALSQMELGRTVPNRVQEEHIAEALEMTPEERAEWTELIKLGEAASMRRKSEAAARTHAEKTETAA